MKTKIRLVYRSARWIAKDKGQFEMGKLFLLPKKEFNGIMGFRTAKGNIIIRREVQP